MKKQRLNGNLQRLFSSRVFQYTHRFNGFFQTKTSSFLSLFLIGMVLSACSPVPPFVDARREAGQVGLMGQSTLDRPAICYNRYATRQVDVDKLAEEECQKTGRRAVFEEDTKFTCCLVAPATAFYRCERTAK